MFVVSIANSFKIMIFTVSISYVTQRYDFYRFRSKLAKSQVIVLYFQDGKLILGFSFANFHNLFRVPFASILFRVSPSQVRTTDLSPLLLLCQNFRSLSFLFYFHLPVPFLNIYRNAPTSPRSLPVLEFSIEIFHFVVL